MYRRHIIAIAALAAAVVTAIAVVTLVLTRGSGVDINSLLMDRSQLSAIMGEKDMVSFARFDNIPEETATVSPENCHAIQWTAGQREYAPTKWTAMREDELSAYGQLSPASVDESVFRVPSADLSQDFIRATAAAFKGCLSTLVTSTPKLSGEASSEVFRDFQQKENSLIVFNSMEKGDGTCQRVVAVASTYIADVRACGRNVTNQAETIVQKILAKAQNDG